MSQTRYLPFAEAAAELRAGADIDYLRISPWRDAAAGSVADAKAAFFDALRTRGAMLRKISFQDVALDAADYAALAPALAAIGREKHELRQLAVPSAAWPDDYNTEFELKLSGAALNAPRMRALLGALRGTPPFITTLKIDRNALGDDTLAAMCAAPAWLGACTLLDLADNSFTSAGMRTLAPVLPRLKLEHLFLRASGLIDDRAGQDAYLVALTDYTRIPEVRALQRVIGSAAYRVLAQYLRGNASIQTASRARSEFENTALLNTMLDLNGAVHVGEHGEYGVSVPPAQRAAVALARMEHEYEVGAWRARAERAERELATLKRRRLDAE